MGLVFIHGVNTRAGGEYDQDCAARDELVKRLVLTKLKNGRYAGWKPNNVYWGDLGVDFAWGLQTIPRLAGQGGGDSTPNGDTEMLRAVTTSAGPTFSVGVRAMGGADAQLLAAIKADPLRILQAIFEPLILSEKLLEPAPDSHEDAGKRQAILLIAANDVGNDHAVRARLQLATTADDALQILREELEKRFDQLVGSIAPAGTAGVPKVGTIRPQGAKWDSFKDQISEWFERAKSAPGRAASDAGLRAYRYSVHERFARFFGDVFVYLMKRNDHKATPPKESIPSRVMAALNEASADGTLVVITHSMGGNIFYDIVTTYAPALAVDAWISVGGQVGQFEEMKMFVSSDPSVRAPDRVPVPIPWNVKKWLNLYDPVDPFAFKVAPVFKAISVADDREFNTGGAVTDAHGAYFKRHSFYKVVLDWLEQALP